VLRGPGGTLTIDSSGITLEATAIYFKGPVEFDTSGAGNTLSLSPAPTLGKPLAQMCAMQKDGSCPLSNCPCRRGAS
jgi:type VI secretion system secreted protein VgrG